MPFIVLISMLFLLAPSFAAESREDTVVRGVEEVEELPEGLAVFNRVLLDKYIEGDWRYMTPLLICFILGMAILIERIIILHLAVVNPEVLLDKVNAHIKEGDVEGAQALCRNTRGPLASVLIQGLFRLKEGVASAEQSVATASSVEIDKMRKGLVWVGLFIVLAPMLGFMGTVIGMIQAFDNIVVENDISPGIVAGGIKVALLTTVAGLMIAVVLQLFYNYCISKIESIISQIEETGARFVDIIYDHRV